MMSNLYILPSAIHGFMFFIYLLLYIINKSVVVSGVERNGAERLIGWCIEFINIFSSERLPGILWRHQL